MAPTAPPQLTRSRLLRRAATGVVLTGVLALTACQTDSRPDPRQTADQLASAIADQKFADLPLTDGSREVAEELPKLLEPLGQSDGQATVGDVTVDRDEPNRATADLEVTWNLTGFGAEGSAWTYPTAADLRWDEDAQTWELDLRPDDVVAGLAPGGTVEVDTALADRGRILDGAGEPLMMERPVARLGLDKSHIEPDQVESSARALAAIAEIDPDAFAARAASAGEQAFVEAITLRADGSVNLPTSAVQQVPGGRLIEDTAVLAPTRAFARGVLGTYGEPTAEQVENSDGRLTAGQPAGLSGLQATWDEYLVGTPGLDITVQNPDGTALPDGGTSPQASGSASPEASPSASGTPGEGATGGEGPSSGSPGFTVDPVPGQDLTTTLDRRLQELAEQTLADSGVPSALVAVRPSDGHVLAAAAGPEGMSTPIGTSGRYAPGSVFKVVTGLAMLRNGMTPETAVQCPPTINVGGMEIKNFDGYPAASLGAIPLKEAMAQSCNTVFVGQWQDISPEDEAAAGRALGLTPEPVVGLNGAFLASIPEESEGTEHAANLFGQGVVQASPLGMATMAASVAAGHTVQPVVVSHPEIDLPTAAAPGDGGLTEEEAVQLREMMTGAVTHGTVPILQEVPGAPVLAKTGTAQFVSEGETLAHTWLVAIHGDLAVALFFNEGFGGAQTNGPVMRDFLTAAEEIFPSEPAPESR